MIVSLLVRRVSSVMRIAERRCRCAKTSSVVVGQVVRRRGTLLAVQLRVSGRPKKLVYLLTATAIVEVHR